MLVQRCYSQSQTSSKFQTQGLPFPSLHLSPRSDFSILQLQFTLVVHVLSSFVTMPTFLITGCSRGLGLALATQLAETGQTVIATSRSNPTPLLAKLVEASEGRVHHFQIDVTDSKSVQEAEQAIASFHYETTLAFSPSHPSVFSTSRITDVS